MAKCESWTENTKVMHCTCQKEPQPTPWQSKMFRLAETGEGLRMTCPRIMRRYNTQGCMVRNSGSNMAMAYIGTL